jgi:signal transduction histidine kinase
VTVTGSIADSGRRRGERAPGANGHAAAKLGPLLAGSGLGLAGIAERVASCGGNLTVGPTGGDGFAVTARLPAR